MGASGFDNPLTGGEGVLIYPRIKSEDFVPGVSGWSIERDGDAEFNNVVVRGDLMVYRNPSGTLLCSIDENGIRFYDTDGTTVVSEQDENGLSVFDPSTMQTSLFGRGKILLQNEDVPGHTLNVARISAQVTNSPASQPYTYIDSPSIDGGDYSAMYIMGEDLVGGAPRFELFGVAGPSGGSGGTFRLRRGLDFQTEDADSASPASFPGLISVGRGIRQQKTSNTSSSGIGTTETVILTGDPFIARVGRAYRVPLIGGWAGNTAGNRAEVRLRKTDAAGALLGTWLRTCQSVGGGDPMAWPGTAIYFRNTGTSDVTFNPALTLQQAGGGGTVQGWGNGADIEFGYVIEDCGAASNYPFATAV